MTYEKIYQKFMIEYDKANITSSYPSLTKYEIATILDKAYLALIGQKVTGNNIRRSTIESDVKSVSDIQPLITTVECTEVETTSSITNRKKWNLPARFMYFVASMISRSGVAVPMKLIPHESAEKFFKTDYNLPWVKIPVCYVEDNYLYSLEDVENNSDDSVVTVTYIKQPKEFTTSQDTTEFECSDSMAEELISLAITFALENVESPRLTSKLNTRGLEA